MDEKKQLKWKVAKNTKLSVWQLSVGGGGGGMGGCFVSEYIYAWQPGDKDTPYTGHTIVK
jgi:hypothetical protein